MNAKRVWGVDKQHILDEIKRTAASNGGIPLGHRRFFRETGSRSPTRMASIRRGRVTPRGMPVSVGTDQLSIQVPADLELVHAFRTDDAHRIEEYWHRRFAAKKSKVNGSPCHDRR
jgi:hypothetical protein